MGIEGLLKALKKRYPETVLIDVPLKTFRGTTLAGDVCIYAYKYMAVSREEACKFIDVSKENPKHENMRSFWLEKYFQLAMAFVECDINFIPVFDGPPFRLKDRTKEDRASVGLQRDEKIADLRHALQNEPDNDKIRDALRNEIVRAVTFQPQDWEYLEEMLRTMGLPVLKGPYEAEAVCARLVRAGLAAGVVSNDGDTLAHGAGIMIIDVKRSYQGGKPTHKCTCIILSEVLRVLGLSRDAFVDLCTLLGTDYNDNIPKIAWVNSLKLIKQYGSLEAVIANLSPKINLKEHRLGDPALRREIRGYFVDELPNSIPDHPLTLCYDNGLYDCFDRIFNGFNRRRMLDLTVKSASILTDFNQKFASLQNFILLRKGDVDENK
jgi:flap endonuclease-1